jgi:hypothetical protein
LVAASAALRTLRLGGDFSSFLQQIPMENDPPEFPG